MLRGRIVMYQERGEGNWLMMKRYSYPGSVARMDLGSTRISPIWKHMLPRSRVHYLLMLRGRIGEMNQERGEGNWLMMKRYSYPGSVGARFDMNGSTCFRIGLVLLPPMRENTSLSSTDRDSMWVHLARTKCTCSTDEITKPKTLLSVLLIFNRFFYSYQKKDYPRVAR